MSLGGKKADEFNKKFLQEVLSGEQKAAGINNLSPDLYPEKIKAASKRVKDAMETLSAQAGIMQTDVPQPKINFIKAPNSISIENESNRSGIVLGTDRPYTLSSGKGGKGSSNADTIDIVAGRGASCKDYHKKAGVNPNFACDGARIYVSEKTEVDLHFGLAPGQIGALAEGKKRPPASAIGLKSDDTRIIGRKGVKIVTGRSHAFGGQGMDGEKTATGGSIAATPAPPIELIAGNNTDNRKVFGGLLNPVEEVNNLQGIARGEYTVDAMKEISGILEQLISCVDRLLWLQEAFNTALGPSVWEPWRPGISAAVVGTQIATINSSLWNIRIDKILWQLNYLQPFGYKYVASQNVFST